MEFTEQGKLYLMTQPEQSSRAGVFGLTPAHMAYRVGNGPHLFRVRAPVPLRGGVMVADHHGFDGRGNHETLCQEVVRECTARGFSGMFCDFEGMPLPILRRALDALAISFQKRRWTLYVPEQYALSAPCVKVVIPTALSGGSLRQRLDEAVAQHGSEHLALGLEWVAEDFALPAMDGSGVPLTQDGLRQLLRERSPSVYFSDELCAHYFTYMQTGGSDHFILYDDASSIRKKLHIASTLGIREAFLPDLGMDEPLWELMGNGVKKAQP